MGTIAVTGATGYLAEKLIERLITQGHTIHAIARNEGKLIALREKFKSVQIFPCPVEDYLLLKKALNGCDGIFHLAAFKDVILAYFSFSLKIHSHVCIFLSNLPASYISR